MIFFDAAGTLFDLRTSVGEIYAERARHFHHAVAPDALQQAFRQFFGQQPPLAFPSSCSAETRKSAERDWWFQLVQRVWRQASPLSWTEASFAQYFEEVFEFFATPAAWQLFDEALATLADLKKRGVRLGIISNFDSRLYSLLETFQLSDFFEGIYLSSEVGAAKPAPEIFLAALNENHLNPENAIHIGDSLEDDVTGASNVGMTAIWIDRRGEGIVNSPLWRVTNLRQIVEFG